MTPIRELADLIKAQAEILTSEKVMLDEVPAACGIYMELQAGHPIGIYYNQHATRSIPVLFIAKSKEQEWCIDRLSYICQGLQVMQEYPAGEAMAWLDATVATEPNKIGRQEDGQYLYSCVVNITCYF